MLSKTFDKNIASICTVKQLEFYELHCKGMSRSAMGKELGCSKTNATRAIKSIEVKAVKLGILDEYDTENGVGAGRHIGKVTTHVKGDKIVQKWIRSDNIKRTPEQIAEEMIDILSTQVPVRDYEIQGPEDVVENLMAIYPMGDPHLGLYAWAEECGENFDSDICEHRIVSAVDRLVDTMPNAAIGRIHNVGDFFHSDTEDNTTRRSGHHLDVDGRWAKVLTIGIRLMTHCIDRCLEKHETVEVVNAIGNHDDQSSFMLTVVLLHHYRNEPRIKIDTSYNRFHYREFGKVLVGVNHGMIKPDVLYRVMSSDMAEAWGRTKFRYWHTGHIHHASLKEIDGVIIETFRSLKGKDAYETERGYRAGRDMQAILYHKDFGEIERHTCNIAMIPAMAKKEG